MYIHLVILGACLDVILSNPAHFQFKCTSSVLHIQPALSLQGESKLVSYTESVDSICRDSADTQHMIIQTTIKSQKR